MIYKDTKLGLILIFIFCVLAASGCARTKEWSKNFLGISTREVEVARPKAPKKTFERDYDTCYKKVKDILKETGSYIYAEDKTQQLIAFYVSDTDTTVAGVFFTALDQGSTRVEISSPSSSTRDALAAKIFALLDKAFGAPKESE